MVLIKLSIMCLAEYYLVFRFFDDVIFYLITLNGSKFYLTKKEYQRQFMTTNWCRKSYSLIKKLMFLSYVFSGELRMSSNNDVFELVLFFAFSELF